MEVTGIGGFLRTEDIIDAVMHVSVRFVLYYKREEKTNRGYVLGSCHGI